MILLKNLNLPNLGISRAVFFSAIYKLWQSGAGVVGLFLISIYFSPEVQGFYYTFASLVALQAFFELGLYLVISNFASHEWAKLNIGEDRLITGDTQALSRLVSLGRFVFKWYAVVSLIFLLVVGVGGYWFLSKGDSHNVNWQYPWALNIAFSSVLLWCMPFLSLLEGCDQIASVAKFRFWQSFSASIFSWGLIMLGGGLWALPTLSLISLIVCLYFLLIKQKIFFRPFFRAVNTFTVDWKEEMLPMQWRLGLQGIISYFVLGLMVPVIFMYHGPIAAGQMGMTLSIIFSMQSFSLIWVFTKTPRFNILISRHEYSSLDNEWKNSTVLAIASMLFFIASLVFLLYLMTAMDSQITKRVLPIREFILLGLGALFSLVVQSIAVYLRAHKREVLLTNGIFSGISMAFLVWLLGKEYGAFGISASYFFVIFCISFPMAYLVWRNARLSWH